MYKISPTAYNTTTKAMHVEKIASIQSVFTSRKLVLFWSNLLFLRDTVLQTVTELVTPAQYTETQKHRNSCIARRSNTMAAIPKSIIKRHCLTFSEIGRAHV